MEEGFDGVGDQACAKKKSGCAVLSDRVRIVITRRRCIRTASNSSISVQLTTGSYKGDGGGLWIYDRNKDPSDEDYHEMECQKTFKAS